MKKALSLTLTAALAASALTPAAAFAAETPTAKTGLYNIETGVFYTTTQFKALTKVQQKAIIKDANFFIVSNGMVFKGLDLVLKTTTELTTAGQTQEAFQNEKKVTLTPQGTVLDKDGNVITKDPVAPGSVAVESVMAINAKQVEVKFSVAVDKTTAENEDLYFIQRTGDASPVKLSTVDATAVAELQEDGKTVVITTTNDIETSFSISGAATPFKFAVDGVKTAAKEAIEAKTFTISVSDSVAPTFVSASASAKTTTNNVTLKFSEPVVATSGVVKVNGVAASVAPGSNPTELTVTTGANLASGSTYEVELLNFKDFSGNFLTPNPVKTSVTVASNVTAPTISDVKVVRDNLVEVTFDKAMKTSSLSNTSVRLLDGNYTNIAPTNIVSVTPKANTSNRVFQITLDNTPALPFNNGVFTGTLVFTDSIEDSVGNTLNTTNRVVSISEDTTAPSVASASFKKADTTGATYGGVALTNGAVVVKFNEGVSKAVSTVGTLKLIDNNGNDVTSTYLTNAEMTAAQVNPNDNTELVIPLNTTITTAANISSFTLRLPSGVAADLSLATNSSNSSVNTFNVEAGTNTSGDTVKPVIVSATPAANNEIQVAVTEANLDNSSAINLNNYRLDGAPLPTGTYVTVTGTAPNYVIHLHLPAGSISKSRDYALNVSGIKDTAGNVASMFVDNTVALVDDVMPELKTASLNTNGSLTLGYTEALAGVIAATDLKVTLNGKVVDSAQLNLVAGTGGETGKDVLTVNQLVDQGANLAYGGGDDTLYIDVDGVAGYLAGTDILISTGSFTAAQNGVVYDLRNATTLKVGTETSPVTADGEGNALKGNTTITVK
ncbi:S-layer homology domain-containing protein [Sporosarcina jeotgali]|uniref:S-layer homology domain-containing protein n=1 Tax=Sporosarcina jeotgali TaxID=3020056 RepID=A0ABZ0KXK5_9BACL|nr:S-layer homology domain-containing protein [Sporosarcina sp. B2O-1]WOV84719.1 S-layer homology domain-containing protein [Sporosarcina sp. B2O-1]